MRNPGQIGYLLLSRLARFLPRRICYLIGETFGAMCFLLCTRRRTALCANLRVVAGGAQGRLPVGLGLAVMVNFARSLVDTFLIPNMDDGYLTRHVTVIDKAGLRAIADEGKGIVLVTAHLGSWELGGFALARMGYKITTVAGIQFSSSLSPMVKAMKARYGIAVTSARSGGLTMFRALRRGDVVALHIDGDQYLGGLETTFFGRRAAMPRGPAALALRTGAALVPAFALRTSRDRVTIHLEKPISTAGASEATVTRSLVAVVEDFVRQHPDQWCMFRPIWEQAS